MAEAFYIVGRVLAAWGIRGDLKVETRSDNPHRFDKGARLFLNREPCTITRSRRRASGGGIILALDTVTTRNHAETLNGALLEIPEADLMPLAVGEFFVDQIIGLHARTTDGRDLGEVTDVLRTGSNDVYVVQREDGREYLIPALKDVVPDISLERHELLVEPIPGLLD